MIEDLFIRSRGSSTAMVVLGNSFNQMQTERLCLRVLGMHSFFSVSFNFRDFSNLLYVADQKNDCINVNLKVNLIRRVQLIWLRLPPLVLLFFYVVFDDTHVVIFITFRYIVTLIPLYLSFMCKFCCNFFFFYQIVP